MSRTLIRHADVVFPSEIARVNVLLEDGKIAAVDAAAHAEAVEVIDAAGLHLLPGVIDDQVHFREPGLTHKEDLAHATRACAKGGVTTFLEMPNTVPNATTCQLLEQKLSLGAQHSLVNYGFYIGATPNNVAELQAAQRTPGIKIFIGSSTGDLLVDSQEALEQIFAETTLPLTAHCEDESTILANRDRVGEPDSVADHSRIRDHRAALIATQRAIDLARRHQHRFHVLHVSTAEEANFLRGFDQLITAEACPHHLFFNVNDYARLGSRIQMNPSIKTAADNAALWQALHAGAIQVIATDHAPHTLEEKDQPYPKSPSGLPAVENSLALLLNEVHHGRVTLLEVASWMSDAPARVWDIVGKGRIAPGYDADLVLVDLNCTRTIRDAEQQTKARWSPWNGVSLTGWPIRTFVSGHTVFRWENTQETPWFDGDFRGQEVRFDHARGGFWQTPDGVGV